MHDKNFMLERQSKGQAHAMRHCISLQWSRVAAHRSHLSICRALTPRAEPTCSPTKPCSARYCSIFRNSMGCAKRHIQQAVFAGASMQSQQHGRYQPPQPHWNGDRGHMHAQHGRQVPVDTQRHHGVLFPAVSQRLRSIGGVAEQYRGALQLYIAWLPAGTVRHLQALRAADDWHVYHCHAQRRARAAQLP